MYICIYIYVDICMSSHVRPLFTQSDVCREVSAYYHIYTHIYEYMNTGVPGKIVRKRFLRVCSLRLSFIYRYGVAMISRLLKVVGLVCRISSLL